MNETTIAAKKRGRPRRTKTEEVIHEEKEIRPQAEKLLEDQSVVAEEVKAPKEPFLPPVASEKTVAEKIAESRKSLEHVLAPGQRFFESPEGEIIIGESDRDRAWARTMNNGKGGWANPRR